MSRDGILQPSFISVYPHTCHDSFQALLSQMDILEWFSFLSRITDHRFKQFITDVLTEEFISYFGKVHDDLCLAIMGISHQSERTFFTVARIKLILTLLYNGIRIPISCSLARGNSDVICSAILLLLSQLPVADCVRSPMYA